MEIDLTSDPASAQDARERARRDLKDENTWHEPDAVSQSTFTTKKGRHLTATISGWKQMLMTHGSLIFSEVRKIGRSHKPARLLN